MKTPRLNKFLCLTIVTVLSFATGVAAQDVSVSVALDRDSIGMDEQAVLTIEVSGMEQNLPDPQMPTLPKFEVYSQGRSSSISIVNGQVSSTLTYRYILLPSQPGVFPINNVAVVHRNKRYKGNPVTLTVLDKGSATSPRLSENATDESGDSKDYFLEAAIDKKSPYVNEQVTLTIKFYTAVRLYSNPDLTAPPTTGFWTEVLGNKAPFYQTINGRNYRVFEVKYALFPTQTGELTIGRAMLTTAVPSRRRDLRDPFDIFGDAFRRGEEVVLRSSPITINVKPLPTAGRPSDFTGSIGNFRIAATVNKTKVDVNQPVTVTLRISGTGNIKSAAEPLIPTSDDFRIYQASSSENTTKMGDQIGGTKIYEEVFIPRRPGRLEIPAIPFNYFDPRSGKYQEISTHPIALEVTRPEGYVASPEVPYSAPDLTIGSEARDISYIKPDPGSLQPIGQIIFASPVFLAVNGLPVLVLAATVYWRRRREKLTGDIGYARSRAALKIARRRLARARSMAGVDRTAEFYAEIYSALTSFIADKLNISPHGLTTDRVRQLVGERSDDQALLDKISNLMQKCDFARYAPSSITDETIKESLKQAEEIMVALQGVRFDG